MLDFQQVIEHSEQFAKRHLLLGNGFSIACQPDIFTYGSLFDQADFSEAKHIPEVFHAIGTFDFERVIRLLEDASKIVSIYSDQVEQTALQLSKDGQALKSLLIRTIANNHPAVPNEISDRQFRSCRSFLSHFLGDENQNGRVYSLNYDLLLYWALMHDEADDPIRIAANDGFGREDDAEPEFVTWMGESSARSQRVHYLHGALHLFDAGVDLQKYTWVNTGIPLLEQAQIAMEQGKFPLFVAEGESRQKLKKIKHSAYLYHSYKSFSSQMEQRKDALVVFGHSFAENDAHILRKISQGRIPQIYVGLYGDPDDGRNRAVKRAAQQLQEDRYEGNPLAVDFFDAETAKVWGE